MLKVVVRIVTGTLWQCYQPSILPSTTPTEQSWYYRNDFESGTRFRHSL